jgi:hypothetical protein
MPSPEENTNLEAPETSSTPAPLPADQEALFREVLLGLRKAKVPFAVSGAFALRQHTGICRYTKDLDVFLPAEVASRALAHLRNLGFVCEIPDPVWLAKAHRDGFFVDLITGMSNGVIKVDRSWIEHSVPDTIFGVDVCVLAPEDTHEWGFADLCSEFRARAPKIESPQ